MHGHDLKLSRANASSAPSTSSLRSQLAFYLPDLQSLSLTDLQECKWKTRKSVFRALLFASPVLTEQRRRLESLLATRTEEVSKLSAAEATRPARVEAEQLFRNRFMDIVFSALTSLAWPPTLEAFSNPLPALNTQINSVLAAILYILEKAIAPYSTESYSEHIEAAKKDKERAPRPGWRGVIDEDNNIVRNSIDSSRPSSSSSINSTSNSSRRGSSAVAALTRDCRVDERQSNSRSSSGTSNILYSSIDSNDNFSTGSPHKTTGTPQRKSKGKTTNTNRPLQSGLSIDLPSSARSSKAESVMSDLHSEPDSMMSDRSSMTDKHRQPSSRIGSTYPASAPAPSSANSNSGEYNCASSSEISRSIEILQFQNQSLSKQLKFVQNAVEARDEAELKIAILIKDLMRSVREVYEISNDANDFASEEQTAKLIDRERDTSRSKLGSASSSRSSRSVGEGAGSKAPVYKQDVNPQNLWKAIYTKISELNNAWNQATKDAKRTAFSSIDAHRMSSKLFGKNRSSSSIKLFDGPSKIWSHRVFGVQPPIDVKRDNARASAEDTGLVGLDLSRIHQLQRDLLQFSSVVERHIDSENPQHDKSNVFTFPDSKYEASEAERNQNMKIKGFQLILHLAALAPLASLSCEDHKSSSLFGLEQLLMEMHKEDGKERFSLKIQQMLERARVEHMALVRCYQKSLLLLDEWATAAKKFSEKLTYSSTSHEFNGIISHAESIEKNIQTLIDAFDEADNAKITTSESGRSVPPMDMLSRGYMGEEMANLVNTIRATVENLRDLHEATQEMKEDLQSKVSKERIKKINIARDLHNASVISTNYVQQRNPSSLLEAAKEKQQPSSYTTPRKNKNAKSPGSTGDSGGSNIKSRPEFSF